MLKDIKQSSKITKAFTFFMKKEQYQRLRLASYYSGKTMGRILREAIDELDVKGKEV